MQYAARLQSDSLLASPTTGAGRMGEGTQYTVNNQMVNATLMNIADSPTNVQLPGVYKNEEVCASAFRVLYRNSFGEVCLFVHQHAAAGRPWAGNMRKVILGTLL